MNGFTVANARRHRHTLIMRGFWISQEHKVFAEAKQVGFAGTLAEWRAVDANFRKVEQIIGHCPFTPRMMRKMGWNEPDDSASQTPENERTK